MKISRNSPCPCGSGKKYKRCCLAANQARALNDELSELIGNEEVNSIEEAQAFANMFMQNKNHRGIDEFLGLSPDQMHCFLHKAFEPSPWFTISKHLLMEPDAPILKLVKGIADAIDANGLKATATGKLPQKLCKALFEQYKSVNPFDKFFDFMKINKEEDFYELNITRLIMEDTGLLRKTKGRFYLTKKYQKEAQLQGFKTLYPLLFEHYCKSFNWAYISRGDALPFLQQSFLFTAYMLDKFENKPKSFYDYQTLFIDAFPMVLSEVEWATNTNNDEAVVRNTYSHRVQQQFLWFMGLARVELKDGSENKRKYWEEDKFMFLHKLPLFDALFKFTIKPVVPSSSRMTH
jgi:hypothetical protein